MSEGRTEGVAAHRALLGRLAAGRFGDAVGRRVEAAVEDVEDWDRLAVVGEWIVRADSGPELLDGVSRVVGPSGQPYGADRPPRSSTHLRSGSSTPVTMAIVDRIG